MLNQQPVNLGSSKQSNSGLMSSSKKKLSNPALLFCSKSNQKENSGAKMLSSENNSNLMNVNRSPMRLKANRTQQQQNPHRLSNMGQRSPLLHRPSENHSSRSHNQHLSSSNLSAQNYSMSRISAISEIEDTTENEENSFLKESFHYCENHEQKMATFATSIDMSNTQYYCEKCAILLASQGYNVQRILSEGQNPTQNQESFQQNSSRLSNRESSCKRKRLLVGNSVHSREPQSDCLGSEQSAKDSQSMIMNSNRYSFSDSTNPRKAEVEKFLKLAERLTFEIERQKDCVRENLIQSEEFYGEQIEQINEYFEMVYQSLELEKNKCYNYILNQRKEVEMPIRLINETMAELKCKIESIVADISENLETVFAAEQDVYRLVISQYEENYQEIHKKISHVSIEPVEMRKIDFEGVPDTIYQLSDVLKESIQNNGQFETTNRMNQQLESLRDSVQQELAESIKPKKLFSINSSKAGQAPVSSSEKQKLCFSFEGENFENYLSSYSRGQVLSGHRDSDMRVYESSDYAANGLNQNDSESSD